MSDPGTLGCLAVYILLPLFACEFIQGKDISSPF